MNTHRFIPALAGLNGLLAIAIGAFGAHAITDPQAKDWIATATLFQLPHAASLLALLAWRPNDRSTYVIGLMLGFGALLFAGSLQMLALGAPKALAAAAPVGGTLMMLGWLLLLIGAFTQKKERRF